MILQSFKPNFAPMKNLLLIALVATSIVATSQKTKNNSLIQKASRIQTSTNLLPLDPKLEPFYHGVASGDPLSDRVIIWTRITPKFEGPGIQVQKDVAPITSLTGKYFVAKDTSFTQTVTSGNFSTDESKDYTVKIDVVGLEPNTTYYYYFSYGNKNSIVGRTKTIPTGSVNNLKFAVISCSNYEGGVFNAYGRIADRNDINAVLHLGDYIYEYGAGVYGNPFVSTLLGRVNQPSSEIVDLADYRTRYSLYRLDRELMRAHQQQAFITVWDDHESANDSYKDGAENHTEGAEGAWLDRKAVSKKVYFEWMPIREQVGDKIYRKMSYGNLADIIMLDTRLEGRDKYPVNFDDVDPAAPNNRKMLGNEQLAWFKDNLKNSTAKWKIIGNQVIFANYNVGFAAVNETVTSAVANTLPSQMIASSVSGIDVVTVTGPLYLPAIRTTENNFIDNWKVYPVERAGIIDFISTIPNVVFVTGDSHCSWAFDVVKDPVLYPLAQALNVPQPSPYYVFNTLTGIYDGSKAVEFGTPSISSPNFDEALGSAITAGFEYQINNPVAALGGANYNPHLKYVDLDQHGYFVLDLTAAAAQADFYYSNVTTTTNLETFGGKSARTLDGQNRVQITTTASGIGVVSIPAPKNPKVVLTSNDKSKTELVVLSVYPNPANDVIFVQLGIVNEANYTVSLLDLQGRLVKRILSSKSAAGIYNLGLDVKDVSAGTYLLVFESSKGKEAKKVVIE